MDTRHQDTRYLFQKKYQKLQFWASPARDPAPPPEIGKSQLI